MVKDLLHILELVQQFPPICIEFWDVTPDKLVHPNQHSQLFPVSAGQIFDGTTPRQRQSNFCLDDKSRRWKLSGRRPVVYIKF